jgi:hypothetical protein
MAEKVEAAYGKSQKRIVLHVNDPDGQIVKLLEIVKRLGGWGCSRTVGIIDDKEFQADKEMRAFIDGDGSCKIFDMSVQDVQADEGIEARTNAQFKTKPRKVSQRIRNKLKTAFRK